MKLHLVMLGAALSVVALSALTGCDDTLEKRQTTEVKRDGTVVKDREETRRQPDGTIVKEEEHTRDRPNP
jgi:hypothetical protein